MKIETKRTLTLTRAEQKAIHDIYKIFDNDNSLDVMGVWDILNDIYEDKDNIAQQYGYNIEIVD